MRINPARAAMVLLAVCILIGVMERRAIAWRYHKMMGVKDRVWQTVVDRATLKGTGICLCRADRQIRFRRSDELELSGSLYEPNGSGRKPGIILVHGMTSAGQHLPVYRLLATELADRGFTVLTIDLAGFGESEDPYVRGNEQALDLSDDVLSAYRLMRTFSQVQPDNISLISHSMGSIYSLKAFALEPGITRLAMIGPPRRFQERLNDDQRRKHRVGAKSLNITDAEYFYLRQQNIREVLYGKSFPEWWTQKRHTDHYLSMAIDRYVDFLREPEHRPVFLIDGGLEGEQDKRYLEDYFGRIGEPKRFYRVPNADHYLNTDEAGPLLVFDKKAVSLLADELDHWFKTT